MNSSTQTLQEKRACVNAEYRVDCGVQIQNVVWHTLG
jgi:hypothetical protein